MQFQYDPRLKILARELRKKSTLAEVLLWQCLRKRQQRGYDFHRQKPIGVWIVDFFAPELMLAIEIDGGSHKLEGREDDERQSKLEALGIRFLRFEEKAVRSRLDDIVQAIDDWIVANEAKR